MSGRVRRVVTAQSPGGRARIVSDGPVPNVHRFGDGGPVIVEVWKAFETPVPLQAGAEEPAAGPMALLPPKRGHIFRIAEIPPEAGQQQAISGAELFQKMGAREASTGSDSHAGAADLMHRTETLDYGIVLQGEVTLVLDEGETDLRAGDVVIQRGSNHGWVNRSNSVCRMAFFMTDAIYPQGPKD